MYHHKVHTPFMRECIATLRNSFQKKFKTTRKTPHIFKIKTSIGECTLETDYYPFDGHASKLGHYYRHLYQIIKYVVTDKTMNMEFKEKYSYIKTIRAQLSNHEQALIYYNSFFKIGEIWWEDKTIDERNEDGGYISYFLDYAIIKNLPFNLTKFGKDPKQKFEEKLSEQDYDNDKIENKMKEIFEWMEDI